MSKLEVNTIEPQCGTTLTLGANNDFIKLGTGAGFSGGIGAVRWETTAQTGSFGATAGRGYFMNTTSGPLTLTLPASPSAGDIVAIKDYAGTFANNNLTINRNGSKLNGNEANKALDTNNLSMTLVYVDSTQGWVPIEEGTGFIGENFVVATGGTITTSGNDRIHTFTGPGTFTVCSVASCATNNLVSYLVVAGGGGGGGAKTTSSGAGGAGGYREVKSPVTPYTASPLDGYSTPGNRITVTAQGYPITVGAGGAGGSGPGPQPNGTPGCSGSNSIFSTITSAGGGAGAREVSNGCNGGSGGGGGGIGSGTPSGGTGNTPPTTPAQGTNGGTGGSNPRQGGGGGGGATAAGGAGSGTDGGDGGAGATSSINGTPTARAGGGGGSVYCGSPPNMGTGGAGGGGVGGYNVNGTAGTVNTGGGGGASGGTAPNPLGADQKDGGAGGSGIVIIRYKYQ